MEIKFEVGDNAKVGDIVYLKSGSPQLTIKAMKRAKDLEVNNKVTVSWFDRGRFAEEATFYAAQLSTDSTLENVHYLTGESSQ
jgi:uncharacterized protein YodC (DUF2158 family)